ncbi:VOC family protein [Bacillus sp. LBG-1-113]|nr:VOC family protein [Bacillus sp. LBG-1-113]
MAGGLFECEKIFSIYDRMKANDVEFLSEPNQMEWSTLVQIQDEDGNEF